jgi:hypothetical protein
VFADAPEVRPGDATRAHGPGATTGRPRKASLSRGAHPSPRYRPARQPRSGTFGRCWSCEGSDLAIRPSELSLLSAIWKRARRYERGNTSRRPRHWLRTCQYWGSLLG